MPSPPGNTDAGNVTRNTGLSVDGAAVGDAGLAAGMVVRVSSWRSQSPTASPPIPTASRNSAAIAQRRTERGAVDGTGSLRRSGAVRTDGAAPFIDTVTCPVVRA